MTRSARAPCCVLPGDFVNLGDAMLSLATARRMAQGGGRVALLPYRRPSQAMSEEFGKEGFQVISIREQPLLALMTCLRASIWIGGGHAVRNEVSLGWLLFTAVVSWVARRSGRNVRVIGAGASSVGSRWRRVFFGAIFSSCDKLCVRDGTSARSLRTDFPAASHKVHLTADVAFLKEHLELDLGQEEPFSCVVSPGIDVVEGRAEDPREILSVLRVLFERFGMRHVIVVSHDSRSEFDLPFCRALERLVQESLPVTVEVMARSGIEQGLLQPYARARWIITGRLHGLIIGAKLCRSVVYTSGSANKLRPFAELFAYVSATHAQQIETPHLAGRAIAAAVASQAIAAELNFA